MRPRDLKVGEGGGEVDVLASSGGGIEVSRDNLCSDRIFDIRVPTINSLVFGLHLSSAMAENRAIVTYTTASSFLLTGAWKQIQAALRAQFPLRNIHWKPASGSSILTIQELDVKLVPFESVRDEHASQIPMTLLEKPLLHIYVVTCEVLVLRRLTRKFTC